jgi:two-component system, sensor histidine kinase and response regulator
MTSETHTPCILVVDDVAENIDVLAGALANDYEVKIALDGEAALDIAFSPPPPDLILLDIMMPGIDGYEVCRRLKDHAEARDIPVIFVTAMGEIEDEAKGFEVGGADYITKPIRTPIVLARVNAHLELKKAKEDLKEQNRVLQENLRLKEDVDRIIRHDLKTPLNVVMWVPDLLNAEGNLSADQIKMLNMLKRAGFSMLQIINNSINLLKMERGEYQVQAEPVNILTPLSQIKNEMQGLMRTKHLNFLIHLNGKAPCENDTFTIQGEEILFYTMLGNLIKNAMEASPNGETVSVSLTDEKDFCIRMHNQGVVPENIRNRFFEKYVTGNKRIGTGLGTYSARLIAETLSGSIDFETSEKAGTTVSIRFPKGSNQ